MKCALAGICEDRHKWDHVLELVVVVNGHLQVLETSGDWNRELSAATSRRSILSALDSSGRDGIWGVRDVSVATNVSDLDAGISSALV